LQFTNKQQTAKTKNVKYRLFSFIAQTLLICYLPRRLCRRHQNQHDDNYSRSLTQRWNGKRKKNWGNVSRSLQWPLSLMYYAGYAEPSEPI